MKKKLARSLETLSPDFNRPAWMDRPGIVMAGSWEAPSYRARLMGRTDYILPPEKQAEYDREHSPEMIDRLRDLGINFLMIHCYKGAGLKTEGKGMDDARRFTCLVHQSGLRVGTYIGGTLLFERLFDEEPHARDWRCLDDNGSPVFYMEDQPFRYTAVRNHPGFIGYLKKPVRYAVKEIQADLILFDNFGWRPAYGDPFSKQQFKKFLKSRKKTMYRLDYLKKDYRCQALTDHYAAMSRYIRSLNPQCGVNCNPSGSVNTGVDFARLAPFGDAIFDESPASSWSEKDGAYTRIRPLKINGLYGNSTFLYCTSALDLAESMAFNVNCLGCVAWFQWGNITASPYNNELVSKDLQPYIRFFLDNQELYRNLSGEADVAVLRTFAQEALALPEELGKRKRVEQGLIEGHVTWRIIYDEHMDNLAGYKILVIPDKEWLNAEQQEKIAGFSRQGGLVVRASDITRPGTFPKTVRERLRVAVEASGPVALEVRQQNKTQHVVVHLVNYNSQQTIRNVAVKINQKAGTPKSMRLMSPDPAVSQVIPFKSATGNCSFVVPELKTYAAIVIEGIGI